MKKTYYIIIGGLLTLLNLPNALAQRAPIIPQGSDPLIIPSQPGTGGADTYLTGAVLPNITKTVIALSGALAVLFIVIGGIQILTAYGNTTKIQSATKTITWAIAGLLIAILSYAIVSVISNISL